MQGSKKKFLLELLSKITEETDQKTDEQPGCHRIKKALLHKHCKCKSFSHLFHPNSIEKWLKATPFRVRDKHLKKQTQTTTKQLFTIK